jgi:hypothetical protein
MTGLDEILEQESGRDITTPETTETETETKTEENTSNGQGEEKPEETEKEEDSSTTPSQEEKAEEAPAIPPSTAELNQLREFVRAQRKEIAAMQAKLSRVKDNSETDDEGNTKIEYSRLEKLQMELHNVAIAKTPILEVLVEAMEVSPKYSDIYEVCTKAHFDDIFEMAATNISRQEGRDFNEVLVEIELEVWKKANPYKYMYTIIKTNHPQYKGKETTGKVETAKISGTAKKLLEAKEAPGSIAALGGGETKSSSAWTSARIDDLDESELHQVPKEIYDKYMMGKLK